MPVVNSCDYLWYFLSIFFKTNITMTGRVTDLLDDGSTLLCETTSWSYSYYRPSRPLPRGGLGGVAFLGATGETDGTLPSTRARNLACYPYATHM